MATTPTLRSLRQHATATCYLHLWHLLSLDAPTVAVIWTLAIAWTMRIQLPPWVPLLLALGAWAVYIGDRLMDARAARTPLRERHRFHWQYRRILMPAAVVAAVAASSLVVFAILHHQMPVAARERNVVLVAAAFAYLGSVHSSVRKELSVFRRRDKGQWLSKELLVGMLFTLACAAPTLSRMPSHRLHLLLPVAAFFLVAWLNCAAIESWERDEPAGVPNTSNIASSAIGLAVATGVAAACCMLATQLRPAALLLSVSISACLIAWLDAARPRFTPTTLRALADLVLLTPAALLVLP